MFHCCLWEDAIRLFRAVDAMPILARWRDCTEARIATLGNARREDLKEELLDTSGFRWCRAGLKLTAIAALNHFAVVLIVLAVAVNLPGCASPASRHPETDIRAAESKAVPPAVTIITVRQYSYEQGVEIVRNEKLLTDCIQNAIRRVNPNQDFIPFEKLTRLVFTNLPAHRVPRNPEYLEMLVKDPRFLNGAGSLGLRYLVFVGGTTETTISSSGGCVGGGPAPAAACLAFVFFDKDSQISASVMDIHKLNFVETDIKQGASGTSWIGILGFIPLGYYSPTVEQACNSLGQRVGAFLIADKVSE